MATRAEEYKMQSEELEEAKGNNATEPVEMTFSESLESAPQNILEYSLDDLKTDFTPEVILPVDAKSTNDSPPSSDTEEDSKPTTPENIPQNFYKPMLDLTKNIQNEQNQSESIRTWLQRITQMQNEIQKKLHVSQAQQQPPPALNVPNNPSRVVKYQDLPYMGEMTLDNSKPRRGRKPKKADICHLIYKNYGTIFPGTPNAKSMIEKKNDRSDVQNRIISSLLEKRLTQESKRGLEKSCATTVQQNEPLNLCIRDLDHLKIRLMEKPEVEVKSEPHSDDEVEFVHETPSPASSNKDFKFPQEGFSPHDGSKQENGYVYWPSAGVFIHPMALQQQLMYYQKMASTLPKADSPQTQVEAAPELRKIVPKQGRSKKVDADEDVSSEVKVKRNASGGDKTPAKRKRSAIFIPPIPAENQNNPATEVSICKFKFTGGAKPSLQEKKMLSVDSGGNFRYYSGTGDKSMRGYEFFPRETLQQQINNSQGSSTGAFLQASGEKIYPSSPIDFTNTNEFMMTPEIPPSSSPAIPETASSRSLKKRKSRKSLQREKLEQTFKEKGFLIQTQQLESAEGATYCKFRQLRKFTRYLFRSWKDYLPGNVSENPEGLENQDKAELEDISEDLELARSEPESPN